MTEEKKKLIREAAVKVIAGRGFHHTRISQIAREADVAVGTIYNYFHSKEEILEDIFSVELKKRLHYLTELQNREMNFWNKISIFLERYFQEIKGNLAIGKILIREKELSREKGLITINDYVKKISEALAYIIEDGIKKKEVRYCNTEMISAIIFGSVQGIIEKAVNSNNLPLLAEATDEIVGLLKCSLKLKKGGNI